MSSRKPAPSRPSKTAELAAAARALHLRRHPEPIFEDDLALAMCGPLWRTVVSSKVLSRLVFDGLLRDVYPIMPSVFTRARFGEDKLETEIRRGIDQCVIIGAGYETFAMRRKDLMLQLTVYELDQPATQEEKRRRMRKAGISAPERLRYVAADLNTETLEDALGGAGFDAGRPALFSCFGVTYYTGKDAVRKTLQSIAERTAPGSSVMFDYLADSESTPRAFRDLRKRGADFVARRGEPWISSFDPAGIPDFLVGVGYSEIVNLKPDEIGSKYFSRHPDLIHPPFIGLCHATTSAG